MGAYVRAQLTFFGASAMLISPQIHFNGTTDKWNELYDEKAQGWTKIYDHTDPQTEQDVYTYITFSVICTNGTLTYTGTNE